MSSNAASIVAAIGSTGTGKGVWIKNELRKGKPRRVIIWDPQDEYGDFGTVFTDTGALLRACAAAGAGPIAAVYRPGLKLSGYQARFNWLCDLVYRMGKCLFVAEELADVTEPSRASDEWSALVRKGRHRAIKIVAAAQRPALVDKDFFGNCTLIHCGRLNFEADLRVMAGVLGVPASEIAALPDLHFIEKNVRTRAIRKGNVAPT